MKAVKAKLAETNPDRVAAFEKGAAGFAKKIVANFGDYEFVRIHISPLRSTMCSRKGFPRSSLASR